MRFPMTCLALTALALVPVTRAAEKPADKTPLPALQGTWTLKASEAEEQANTTPIWWVIKGNTIYYGGKELARAVVDDSTKPRCLDLTFRTPKRTLEGIYAVDGDTLKICVNRSADGIKDRPAAFSTRDKPDWRLLVSERGKDRKIDDVEGLGGFVGLMIKADKEKQTVVIDAVLEDSPAKKAGLKKDDILLQVGGAEVKELVATIKITRQAKPGSELKLRIRRGDQEKDVTVKVGVLPFFQLD